MTRSNPPSSRLAELEKAVQRRMLPSDMRADKSAVRAPRDLTDSSSEGQSSLSAKMASSGAQYRVKRAAKSGVSTGAYWWITPSGRRRPISSAAATVPLVIKRVTSGRRARSPSMIGSSDRPSPTLAPCSQTRGPCGRARLGLAMRSSIRAASSLPALARWRSRPGVSQVTIRPRAA